MPDCKQVESRAAVVTVRNAARPLEVEEGELVDDSDDEGALVIDESEGKKKTLFVVISRSVYM